MGCWMQRRKFLRLKTSCTVIQTWRRGVTQRSSFARNRRLVIVCQSAVRGFLDRKRTKSMKQEALVERSAIMIQKNVKGWMARKTYSEKQIAILSIQSWLRANMERNQQRRIFVQMKNSTVLIQSIWRGRKARIECAEKRNKVIKFQAVVKGWLERKRFDNLKRATIKIQIWWRAQLFGRIERDNFLSLKMVSLKLQSLCRGRKARIAF